MIDQIFNRTKPLEKALNASWLRNEAISQNISNVDTPNYKRKTVAFADVLADEGVKYNDTGKTGDSRYIPVGSSKSDRSSPKIVQDNTSLSTRLDGNNVDIDSEMAGMAKNTIQYNVLIQSLSQKFKSIKSVISEGRK